MEGIVSNPAVGGKIQQQLQNQQSHFYFRRYATKTLKAS